MTLGAEQQGPGGASLQAVVGVSAHTVELIMSRDDVRLSVILAPNDIESLITLLQSVKPQGDPA